MTDRNEELRQKCLSRHYELAAGGLSTDLPSWADMIHLTISGQGSYQDITRVYEDRPELRQEYEDFGREMLGA